MHSLNAIRLFTATVEAGSFSAAGRRLGLAPSSVSRQVTALEDGVGARLLHRTTRNLSLTEAGRVYFERISRILAELDEACAAVADLEAEPRGSLHVNAPYAFGVRHVAPALPDFLARFPEVRIELALTDSFVDLLEVGADVAIRVGELEDSSLVARRLATSRRLVCATPAYLARAGTPARPDDLTAHDCLIYTRHRGQVHWNLQGPDGPVAVPVEGSLRTNNTEAVHAALRGGLGVALMPAWLVGEDVRSGALVELLRDWRTPAGPQDTGVHALYPASRHLSPKVRAFVDFLVKRFASRPGGEYPGEPAARSEAH